MAKSDSHEGGVLRYLDGQVAELHKNVPKAIKEFDADAIHDARVATRRLKASLDLLRAVLTDEHREDFGKILKKIRKRLGPLRDLDVMIERLRKLSGHRVHGPAAQWLVDHLQTQKTDRHEKLLKKAGAADLLARLGAWWHVREEVVDSQEAIGSLLAESLHLQLDAFAERAEGVIARLGGSAQTDPGSAGREDPHQLRIAGKLLRYTLELARAHGSSLPSAVVGHFKRMQEALGNWHDDVVLIECVMRTSLDEAVSYHDAELQKKLLELDRYLLGRAACELQHFSRLWQKRGNDVARIVREKLPLTRAVNEPQTGPDPSGSGDTPVPAALPPDAASNA